MPHKENPIKGSYAEDATIAAVLSCKQCGWKRLVINDEDAGAQTVESCPLCGNAVVADDVTADMVCPHCTGGRGVLSIMPNDRTQICADCARLGHRVDLVASDVPF